MASMANAALVLDGEVVKSERGGLFRVRLDKADHEVLAYPSGKMRMGYIRIMIGDRVQVAVSPYDLTRGRIVWRYPARHQAGAPAASTPPQHGPVNARRPWQ